PLLHCFSTLSRHITSTTLFPYTTLFRSSSPPSSPRILSKPSAPREPAANFRYRRRPMKYAIIIPDGAADDPIPQLGNKTPFEAADRKSTRLNSSHDQISYAVFCLKKKIH